MAPPTTTPSRNATMNDRLTAEIERIRSNSSIPALDEAAVKQGVILRVLNALGWDTFDIEEVKPEHSVGSRKVDYALRLDGRDRVFLEAKRPSEDLGNHAPQLLDYSFREGVPLAVLTNGLTWWFYLPLQEGSWEERRFSVIELRHPDVSQTTDSLIDFLSKESVRSGVAVGLAEGNLYRLWQDKKIEEALPKAWNQLITDPDDQFLALLNQKVMELCGFGASLDQIKRFLSGLPKSTPTPLMSIPFPTPTQFGMQGPDSRYPHRSKGPNPVSFMFCGERFEVRYWSNVLVRLGEAVYERHRTEFSKVGRLGGWHLDGNSTPANRPKPIGDSGWYVYTNRTKDQLKSMCHKLLIQFGYSPDDLQIETT